MAEMTQQQKIVAIMCSNKNQKWWKPHDIMNVGDSALFVGYETSARLSELAKDYPDMIESKREGKYILRRMRFETGKEWFHSLPKDLRSTISKYYKK